MGKDEELEEKRQANANFLSAFDYVMERLGISQKELCELIDSKSPYISFYRSGRYPVPDKTKYALVQISVERGIGQISMDYLDGYTDIMLLSNIPAKELAEIKMRRSNPDYDAIQKRMKEKEHQIGNSISQPIPYIDPSSQQNASISAYIQLTNRLDADLKQKEIEMKERLSEKDVLISSLKSTISDKESIIKEKDNRIAELERKLASIASSDLERYPFAIGAAEDRTKIKL